MFAPQRMTEVNLFIYEDAIEAVILSLARLGTLHVEDDTAAQGGAQQNRWTALSARFAGHERRLHELLEALDATSPDASVPADLNLDSDLARIAAFLDEAGPAVDAWHGDYTSTAQELDQLRFLSEQMRLLAPLDVPVERLTDLWALHLVVGTLPAANLARIQTALFRIPFVIIPTYTHAARTLIFSATPKEYAPILDRALRSAFFQPIELPAGVSGPPAQVLIALEEQASLARQHLTDLQDQRNQLLACWREQLVSCYGRAQACRGLAETIQRLPVQGQVYVISGWVPASQLQATIDAVQQVTNGRAIIEVLEPEMARPQVPTRLRNPRLLAAFEALVTNYGVPAYDELDPTLVFSLSFLLMYGMMFGDIGHGLLLTLSGLWLALRPGSLARFGPLLILCGLSAALFGLLYGTFLGQTILPALWLRPAEAITSILIAALAAGVLLLNVGFLLHLVTNWRTHNRAGLLFDNNGVAGLTLYWALLGGALAVWQGMLAPRVWLVIVLVPAVILFLKEPLSRRSRGERPRPQAGWGEWAVLAFFELFEAVISFAGNTLSFVRLGAFAVAHEALSQVVWLIAGLGGGFSWLVLIIGTIFIVVFEGLIVGIQTLRLEYYEFFGRFFRGDGRPFKPLRLSKENLT